MEGAQWEIPVSRMKAKRVHWVPLPPQAVALLTRLRALVPADREYLFPNRVDPRRPMANCSLNALMERLGLSGIGTPHGMRASFSTYFNSTGGNIDVLQQWADYLDRLRQERPSSEHEPITPAEKTEKTSVLVAKPEARRVVSFNGKRFEHGGQDQGTAAPASTMLYVI